MKQYLGEFETTRMADSTPVDWAMLYIGSYGQIDGSHHKTWVLDQVARILKGTPVIVTEARWGVKDPTCSEGMRVVHAELRYQTGEPSQEYLDWVEMMKGEDGEEYDYDEGTPP